MLVAGQVRGSKRRRRQHDFLSAAGVAVVLNVGAATDERRVLKEIVGRATVLDEDDNMLNFSGKNCADLSLQISAGALRAAARGRDAIVDRSGSELRDVDAEKNERIACAGGERIGASAFRTKARRARNLYRTLKINYKSTTHPIIVILKLYMHSIEI